MIKQVFLIRHATASYAHSLQNDYERTLLERGKREVAMMGERLKYFGIHPDIIIASAAKRTQQTAEGLAQTLHVDIHLIRLEPTLYHSNTERLLQEVQLIPNNITTAFLIAHNPGITEFVNSLTPIFKIEDMPTCGIVGVRFDAQDWLEFEQAEKELFLFEYPSKLYGRT